jgi:FkbM family methyltransferase
MSQFESEYRVPGAGLRTVRVVTADSFLVAEKLPPPDFLKIDAEGSAAAVLRGAHRLLLDCGPIIFVELHGPEERQGVK